jgi:hypothetical protein
MRQCREGLTFEKNVRLANLELRPPNIYINDDQFALGVYIRELVPCV